MSYFAKIYGSMYLSSANTPIVLVTKDVWVGFASGWSDGGNTSGLTFQNNNELKVNYAGKYVVTYMASGLPEQPTDALQLSIAVNGNVDLKFACLNRSSIYPYVWTGTGIRSFAANDTVLLCAVNNTATGDIYFDTADLSMARVG